MDVSEIRAKTKEEAAAWLLKLQAGEMSHADRDAFVDWLRESPVHIAEMLRVTNVYESLQSFQHWDEVDTQGPHEEDNVIAWADVEPRPSVESDRPAEPHNSAEAQAPRARPLPRILGAIAAGVMAAVVGGFWLLTTLSGQTIQTERGERREVTLSDGSLVQIDPETKLRVKFEEHARDIVLERGRAVFRVARNPARPFSVRAEEHHGRAGGTAFGVERRESGIKVTVAEGKVAILNSALNSANRLPEPVASLTSARDAPTHETNRASGTNDTRHDDKDPHQTKQARHPQAPEAPLLLAANEQIIVASSGQAEAVRKVDSARELAWARGRLVFEREALATVVDDFNRYNRVQLQVANADLAARPISGVFDATDTESFIAFVQSAIDARIVRVGEDTVIIETRE